MTIKIDSSLTGLAFAEEESLKVLPGTAEADAVWEELEPNSYNDFGGELKTIARSPINASRQRKKGTITDLDASGGFNNDLTMNNMQKLLQGFFFADVHEKFNNLRINGVAIPITGVLASDDSYNAASSLAATAGNILSASGFSVVANNGIKVVDTATATKIKVVEALADEVTPPVTAKIQVVGHQFAAGDLSLAAAAAEISLATVAKDLTTLGLNVGEWIFIGGDSASLKFANSNNVPGFARIASIATHKITLDQCTFTATTDTGATKTIQIFFGNFLRNEAAADIIRRSYNLERQLGNDGVGIQSELLIGAIPNEMTLNVPQADKVNIDLSFVALDHIQRTGTQGLKAGDRVAALGEDAINTSSDVYRMRINVVNPDDILNDAFFAYLTDIKLTLKNNVNPNKAIGVLGAFEASVGDFAVDGSLTAYFADVAAIAAIRQNSDVAFNLIFAKLNKGLIFDVPLCSLAGGKLNIEKDSSVTIPITSAAAENSAGYTMSCGFFPYLPDVALPS